MQQISIGLGCQHYLRRWYLFVGSIRRRDGRGLLLTFLRRRRSDYVAERQASIRDNVDASVRKVRTSPPGPVATGLALNFWSAAWDVPLLRRELTTWWRKCSWLVEVEAHRQCHRHSQETSRICVLGEDPPHEHLVGLLGPSRGGLMDEKWSL